MATKVKSFKEQRAEHRANLVKLYEDMRKANAEAKIAADTLPDVSDTNERKVMKDKRTRALIDAQIAKDDIEEAARLYALADLAYMAEVRQQLLPQISELEGIVDAHWHDVDRYLDAKKFLLEGYEITYKRVAPDKEAVAKAKAELNDALTALTLEQKAKDQKAAEIKKKLDLRQMIVGMFYSRVLSFYHTNQHEAKLDNSVTWSRAAHDFGKRVCEEGVGFTKGVFTTQEAIDRQIDLIA